MNIIKLDYDCLGILSDLLCDDLNSLYFFDINNLKPKGKSVDYSNIDWDRSSHNKNISFAMIKYYENNLNFEILTHTFKTSDNFESFCEEYTDKISWYEICNVMRLTELFFKDNAKFSHKFKDYILWDKVSRFGELDEGFICECAEYLNWDIISANIGLTSYLIERFHDKINFQILKYNRYVSNELYEHYLEIDEEKNDEYDEYDDIEMGKNNNDNNNNNNNNNNNMNNNMNNNNNNIENGSLIQEDSDEDSDMIELVIS